MSQSLGGYAAFDVSDFTVFQLDDHTLNDLPELHYDQNIFATLNEPSTAAQDISILPPSTSFDVAEIPSTS